MKTEFPSPIAELLINKMVFDAKLGWTQEERSKNQKIFIATKIIFKKSKAHLTDTLADTLCYDQLTQVYSKFIAENEFKLIEALAFKLYEITKVRGKDILVQVSVTKAAPPVDQIQGGATFTFGDPL